MAAPLDFGSFYWIVIWIVTILAAVTLFLIHEFIIMPPIARKMRAAKWKKGSPAFVQDDAGRVNFIVNDIELPEGVVHNNRGWFLRSRAPYIPEQNISHRGRKKKGETESEEKKFSEQDAKVLDTILEAPVLEGLGKAVFFGYDGSPLLSNLKTLVHADLRKMKEIIPATISRTQLGNLHKWSLNKGYEKRGGDAIKVIILAIAVVGVIAAFAIAAYILTQGK